MQVEIISIDVSRENGEESDDGGEVKDQWQSCHRPDFGPIGIFPSPLMRGSRWFGWKLGCWDQCDVVRVETRRIEIFWVWMRIAVVWLTIGVVSVGMGTFCLGCHLLRGKMTMKKPTYSLLDHEHTVYSPTHSVQQLSGPDW